MVVLVVWYSYLCKLGTLSCWPFKQRNCWKLKIDHLKAHYYDETVTKHMNFLFYRNSWQTWCWDAPKYLGDMDLYSMKSKHGTPSLLCILPFIILQYWCKYHHPTYPTSPECHHMMPNITTWCPNDIMLFLAGIQCDMCLVCWADTFHSECGCQSRCSHPPYMEWETVTPCAYHDTLPQVPWCAPALSQPGYDLLKTYQKYNWQDGMYKDWPKQMVKTFKTWV